MNYFQLDDYTALRISGENVKEFLQGQISSDVTNNNHFKTLFCDEKGYVITNASVFIHESALIIVKKDIAQTLDADLSKFSKFFKCKIQHEDIDVFGELINGRFEKIIGNQETSIPHEIWLKEKLLNFDVDLTKDISGKFRVNELGFNLEEYVSFDKGCYRGQEIIARINYLSKGITKPVVFENLSEKCIEKLNLDGKLIFKKIIDGIVYHQFMLRQDSVALKAAASNQVASLWANSRI